MWFDPNRAERATYGSYDRESEVEMYFVQQAYAHDILVRKLTWIARKGAPDRVAFGRDGQLVFIEFKAPGKAATFPRNPHEKTQFREHERLRKRGQRVVVIDSKEGVDLLVRELTEKLW